MFLQLLMILFIVVTGVLSCAFAYFGLVFWEGAKEPDATMLEMYLLLCSSSIIVCIADFIVKNRLKKIKIIPIGCNIGWIIYVLYSYLNLHIMPILLYLTISMLIITLGLFFKIK